MSKFSFLILLISILIAILNFTNKLDGIKNIIWGKKLDDSDSDKKKYILNEKNNTLEREFRNKYINLKNELINYKNNNTYLKYERDTIEKIKELEKEKKRFEDFQNEINEKSQVEFKDNELKNLTDLIDRYILSEN